MIRNIQKSIASLRVRAFMRVLFGVFLFLYFYFLQSPLLSLAQLQLSEGKTTYYPLVSSIVLSLVLLMVQKLVAKWIPFRESLYCFSYVPSVILAVLTTAFTPAMNVSVLIFCAVAFVGFLLAAYISFSLSSYDEHGESYVRLLAVHSLGMVMVLFSLGAFSNSTDITTYEIKAAQYIQKMDYKKALKIGQESWASSPRLAALRAYALSHTDKGLGECFFTYPLSVSGAEQLLFSAEDTLAQLLPPDSLYAKLGVWRSSKETALQFLERALDRNNNTFAKDYWLTGLLLEKDLKQFSQDLPRLYALKDTVGLPKHYAEAMVLVGNEIDQRFLRDIDSTMIRAYQDYVAYGNQYSDSIQRCNQLHREYGKTYWWYYQYQH